MLAPDAWGEVDLGPAASLVPGVVTGAGQVAGNLLRFWGPGATLVSHPVGGQPAVLAFRGRTLAGLIVFTLRGELIQAVHVIGDPRKLGFVSAQLSGLAVAGRHYSRGPLVLTGAAAIRRPASARAMPGLARKASTCSTSRSSSAAPDRARGRPGDPVDYRAVRPARRVRR